MDLQNNRKRGAFAQLQDALEQIKTEVANQLGDEFGEILPDFNKYIKTKPGPAGQKSGQSGAKRQQPRLLEQQPETTRQQPRSLEQQPRAAAQPMRPQQRQRVAVSAPEKPRLSPVHPGRSLVANLDATSARDAIILSEIIGKPLSKRPRSR